MLPLRLESLADVFAQVPDPRCAASWASTSFEIGHPERCREHANCRINSSNVGLRRLTNVIIVRALSVLIVLEPRHLPCAGITLALTGDR